MVEESKKIEEFLEKHLDIATLLLLKLRIEKMIKEEKDEKTREKLKELLKKINKKLEEIQKKLPIIYSRIKKLTDKERKTSLENIVSREKTNRIPTTNESAERLQNKEDKRINYMELLDKFYRLAYYVSILAKKNIEESLKPITKLYDEISMARPTTITDMYNRLEKISSSMGLKVDKAFLRSLASLVSPKEYIPLDFYTGKKDYYIIYKERKKMEKRDKSQSL